MILVDDERFSDHLRGLSHPERPDRVAAIAAHLAAEGLDRERVPARDATDDEILLVHPSAYLERVKRDVGSIPPGGATYLSTGDTVIDASSLAVARRAAGGAIVAMERAVAGDTAAFAVVRPPGHHAEPARGMGFCIFGNAAIAARVFHVRTGGRALVVDFDYHHGNGTQRSAGDGVSFVSTHAYPQYPGTGSADEQRFESDAIVNVPLPPDTFATEAFIRVWAEALPAIAARVKPDLLVVSAGYDYAAGDPVGDLGIDGPGAAAALARIIREVAQTYARGRVAYVLEGGYDPATLAKSVAATMRAHDGHEAIALGEPDAAAVPPGQRRVLRRVAEWA